MDINTFLIYTYFGIFSITFAYLSQICKRKENQIIFITITYILVVTFWSIRYRIGFDYDNYIHLFYEIKNECQSYYVEPMYTLLCKLFAKIDKGEYMVIASMSALTYLFLFHILIKKRILWLGLFFSLAFQYQFMAANQIRQALAISAFLCLLPAIENKQPRKWIIGIILITLFFHTSALFLLFLIPFCNIKLSGKKWSLIISILFVAYLNDVFLKLGNFLFLTLPIPEKYQIYLLTERIEAEEVGFSLVMLFNILVAIYIAWNYQLKENRIFTLYMIGICMYIIFIEYHLLQRVSFYLFYINIYIASIFYKQQNKKGLWLILASIVFSLFNFAQSTNMHGVIPYKTLFSQI